MMIIVMKFGGTSVAELEKIERAANTAIAARKKGYKVVVVVSAPADLTDDLISLSRRVCRIPDDRELDMLLATGEQISISLLAMAIQNKGYKAISLTAPQAGIKTRGKHTNARITGIRSARILSELKKGKIVVVAGFQGVNTRSDITTLGRGGTNLTAVALAGALRAGACEIYTDVKGIYTADPRIVPQARKLKHMSYREMIEIGRSGSQVVPAGSIELARRYQIPLHVRSAFHSETGTWIGKKEEKTSVSSAFRLRRSKGLPCSQGLSSVSSLTLDKSGNAAKVSIVGTGFAGHPMVVSRMRKILASQKIKTWKISASALRISCLVPLSQGGKAVRALHRAFGTLTA